MEYAEILFVLLNQALILGSMALGIMIIAVFCPLMVIFKIMDIYERRKYRNIIR